MAGSAGFPEPPSSLVKKFTRSVLLSSPKGVMLRSFCREYTKLVNEQFPWREHGYSCPLDLLRAMSDVVRVEMTLDGCVTLYGIVSPEIYMPSWLKKAQGVARPHTPCRAPAPSYNHYSTAALIPVGTRSCCSHPHSTPGPSGHAMEGRDVGEVPHVRGRAHLSSTCGGRSLHSSSHTFSAAPGVQRSLFPTAKDLTLPGGVARWNSQSQDVCSQPLPYKDICSQPLPYKDSYSQPLPYKDSYSQPLPYKDICSQPLPYKDICNQPLPYKDVSSQPLPYKDICSQPLPYKDVSSQPLPHKDICSQPLPYKDVSSQPLSYMYKDVYSQPLPYKDICSQPLPYKDVSSQPLPHKNVCSLPPSGQSLGLKNSHGQSFEQCGQSHGKSCDQSHGKSCDQSHGKSCDQSHVQSCEQSHLPPSNSYDYQSYSYLQQTMCGDEGPRGQPGSKTSSRPLSKYGNHGDKPTMEDAGSVPKESAGTALPQWVRATCSESVVGTAMTWQFSGWAVPNKSGLTPVIASEVYSPEKVWLQLTVNVEDDLKEISKSIRESKPLQLTTVSKGDVCCVRIPGTSEYRRVHIKDLRLHAAPQKQAVVHYIDVGTEHVVVPLTHLHTLPSPFSLCSLPPLAILCKLWGVVPTSSSGQWWELDSQLLRKKVYRKQVYARSRGLDEGAMCEAVDLFLSPDGLDDVTEILVTEGDYVASSEVQGEGEEEEEGDEWRRPSEAAAPVQFPQVLGSVGGVLNYSPWQRLQRTLALADIERQDE